MSASPWTRRVLQALAVAVFGFVLLNATFMLDWGFQSLLKVAFYRDRDLVRVIWWLPPLQHVLFAVLIGFVSWGVLRSALATTYKAIFMTVPTAVVLVTVGMFTYRWPLYSYAAASLLTLGTLGVFSRTRQPWLYYYSVTLVVLTLAVMAMMGKEI